MSFIIGGLSKDLLLADPVEKPYTQICEAKALEDHMNRLGIEGKGGGWSFF